MIIVMQDKATEEDICDVENRVKEFGYAAKILRGAVRTVIAAIGDGREKDRLQALESLHHVESVTPILKPYKLCSREVKDENTVVDVGGIAIGGDKLVVMAGPCSVESEEQLTQTAMSVKNSGAVILRGGAFKPRSSPYSFQGMGEEGLKLLKSVSEKTGLKIVTEIMNPRELDVVSRYTDILQIGARNVQNFSLLKEIGQLDKKPVLLKRGLSTTIEEWLMSAEYIMAGGNDQVILCERGIRTFENATRNTLDLSAVPVVKEKSHLPIIIDPSHGVGYWQYVLPMSLAAIAAGADGLMVEVHWKPEEARSDGPQSLKPPKFKILMNEVRKIADAVGRSI